VQAGIGKGIEGVIQEFAYLKERTKTAKSNDRSRIYGISASEVGRVGEGERVQDVVRVGRAV
jgi:hypothetical protein